MEQEKGKTRALRPTRATYLLPMAVLFAAVFLVRNSGALAGAFLVMVLPPYLTGCGIYLLTARRRCARFVRLYADNEFYINARDASRRALIQTAGAQIVAGVLLAVCSYPVSLFVTGSVRGMYALCVTALILPVYGAESVLAGFAEGMGHAKSVYLTDIARCVLVTAGAVFGGLYGYRYGCRIDALLFTGDCGAAYLACFFAAGILLGELAVLLVLWILRWRILHGLSPLEESGKPRFLGEEPAYFSTFFPAACAYAFCHLVFALLTGIFVIPQEAPLSAAEIYGQYAVCIQLLGMLLSFTQIRHCFSLSASRAAPGVRQKRLLQLLRRIVLVSVPAGAFLTGLSEVVSYAVFRLPGDQTVTLFAAGGFLLPLYTLALTGTLLMILFQHGRALVLAAGMAVSLSVLMTVLCTGFLSGAVKERIFLAPVLMMLAFLLFDVTGLGLMLSSMGLRRTVLLRMFLKPAGCAAAAALMLYLTAHSAVHVIGEMPTLLLGLLAGSVLYLILLAVFRGLEADDLQRVPLGGLLERISLRGTGPS